MTASSSPAVAIINPVAGPSAQGRRWRADAVRAALRAANRTGEIVFTEHVGHGRELAVDFVRRGFSPIIAWGGDGTVNEVASALVSQDAVLGIVPGGSGNGLARELEISLRPEQAIATAILGDDRTIDVGELGGRLFVNVAGVGLDAAIARAFNRLDGRGLLGYGVATVSTIFRYVPEVYSIIAEGETFEQRALFVELANGRQYGHGALIAPHARLDDGRLDVVVVGPRGALRALWGARRLFTGTIDRDPGVTIRTAGTVTISALRPIPFHVDGEVEQGATTLTARVRPRALRVRVPRVGARDRLSSSAYQPQAPDLGSQMA